MLLRKYLSHYLKCKECISVAEYLVLERENIKKVLTEEELHILDILVTKVGKYEGYREYEVHEEKLSKEVKQEEPELKTEPRQCRYNEPWAGICKNKAIEGSPNCKQHQDLCWVCHKNLATHGCSCAGSFVCGVPLCDDEECIKKHWSRH